MVGLSDEEVSLIAKYMDYVDKDLPYFLDMVFSHRRIGSEICSYKDICQYLEECGIQIPQDHILTYYYDGTETNKKPGVLTECKAVVVNGVKTIQDKAFSNCRGISEVMIPDTVKEIGEEAFLRCSGLKNINIPDSVTQIGVEAFYGTGLVKVSIPSSVVELHLRLFADSRYLQEVVMFDDVDYIGSECFYACTSLKNIVIPKNIHFIGYNAFGQCTSLKTINIPSKLKEENVGNGTWEDLFTEESSIEKVKTTNKSLINWLQNNRPDIQIVK